MIQIEEKEIVKGIDEAYKKAGSNAYFSNGFQAGVDFALKQVENLTIPDVSQHRELLLAYEEFTSYKVLGKSTPRISKQMVEDFLANYSG